MFLRLGLTAFGGPAAHVAAMEDELVTRRRWVTPAEFADLVGASNLIPGPNSTELAIHLGFRRAGWPGLLVAGATFIGPAVLVVWAIAALYGAFGARAEVAALLVGMQPVVLAVVVQAIWRLRRSMVAQRWTAGLAVTCLVAIAAGATELQVLAGAVLASACWSWWPRSRHGTGPTVGAAALIPISNVPSAVALAAAATTTATAALTVGGIFWSFAKMGSVLFGSGYVLLSFLRREFLLRQPLLTDGQLLDAIAIGQVTPGPVFSAATFVGYQLGGHAGAAAATAGIFLPAFVAVAVTAPLVHRMRTSPRLAVLLDGVNAAALALMTTVVITMTRSLAFDLWTLGILGGASVLLLTTRIGSGWLLLLGALLGAFRLLFSIV